MLVDSFRFLPRSFRPMFESVVAEAPSEVWAPFEPRLAQGTLALLTSAGLYVKDSQPAFDVERERREPTWGDPSFRVIPADTTPEQLGMAHLHVNDDDVLADPEISLPMGGLSALVGDRLVGGAAPRQRTGRGSPRKQLPSSARCSNARRTAHRPADTPRRRSSAPATVGAPDACDRRRGA